MTTPIPNVIETLEFETLLAQRKADFIARFPADEQDTWQDTLALESEPVTKLLEIIAYLELLLRARVNHAAQANLLAFATAKDLDRLADFYGLTRFPDETDDNFRRRIILRIQGSSTAGPLAHYRHHAMSAHADVSDVHISSPRPGLVLIAVLAKKNTDEVVTAVKNKVTADDVRVLTDTVVVIPAKVNAIDIHAVVKIGRDAPVNIKALLNDQITQLFNSLSLGVAVSRSAIIARLHQADVIAVDLIHPTADTLIDDDTIAVLGNVLLEVQ